MLSKDRRNSSPGRMRGQSRGRLQNGSRGDERCAHAAHAAASRDGREGTEASEANGTTVHAAAPGWARAKARPRCGGSWRAGRPRARTLGRQGVGRKCRRRGHVASPVPRRCGA